MQVPYSETLEGILAMFREDPALFALIEVLMEDEPEVSEFLEDWR